MLLLEAGRPGPQPLDPHPDRLPQDLHRPACTTGCSRASPGAAQQPHLLSAARQDAGRHQLDQRHGLHARHARRLRRLAPARLRGLGLRQRAAVLPQGRGPGARRRRVPRRRRAAQGSRQPVRREIGDAMVEAAIQAGVPRNPDFNGASQEGVGYYQTTTGNRAGAGAPPSAYLKPAPRPEELRSSRQRARHPHPDRGRPRRRRRVPDAATASRRRAPRRGHRLGRRLRLAAIVAAVGDRAGRALQRDRACRWCAICRGSAPTCTTISTTYLAWRCPRRSRSTISPLSAACARWWPACNMRSAARATCRMRHARRRLRHSDPRLEQPDLQINMFGCGRSERLRTGIKPHKCSAFTISPVHLRPGGARHGSASRAPTRWRRRRSSSNSSPATTTSRR